MLHILMFSILALATAAHASVAPLMTPFKGHPESQCVMDYDPDGGEMRPVSRDCDRDQLEEALLEQHDTHGFANSLQSWIGHCEKQVAHDRPASAIPLLDYALLSYSLAGANYPLKSVTFTLHDGRKINGVLAVKADRTPRPLVIAQCGIYCDAEDTSTVRSLIMQLFEESPFHVLVLENPTGAEYSARNHAVSWGGFDSGAQVMEVTQQLRHNPVVAGKFSSVHLVGLSLGSHGVLYGSLYASEPGNGFDPLDSVTAVCPVVDMAQSIERGFQGTFRTEVFRLMTFKALREMFISVPLLGQFLNLDGSVSDVQLQTGIKDAATKYFEGLTAKGWPYNPFAGDKIRSYDDFARLNRFQDYAHLVRVPTLLMPSKDDALVEKRFNTDAITDASPALQRVAFSYGNHCALGPAYGWENITTVLRSHIYIHDRAAMERFTHKQSLAVEPIYFQSEQPFMAARWQVKYGQPYARFRTMAFDPRNDGCKSYVAQPDHAPDKCFRFEFAEVQYSSLKAFGMHAPRSSSEANRMSRWLNANSRAVVQPYHAPGGYAGVLRQVEIQGEYEL